MEKNKNTSNKNKINNKKAQEELVGFALIIVVVAVILLVFLWFSLSKSSNIQESDYQVGNFLESAMQYTTNCSLNAERQTIRQMISLCDREMNCDDGQSACNILKPELNNIINESWRVSKDSPVKGYVFIIMKNDALVKEGTEFMKITSGEQTKNYRTGYASEFKNFNPSLSVYY